jgi:hypothetical protein
MRILTLAFFSTVAASHGLRVRRSLSLARSNARGRSGPSQLVQPVGGCLWYIMVAGPKKPSLPSSRSKVPSGRSACAWREARPSMRGNAM